jgi:hypothetical protein
MPSGAAWIHLQQAGAWGFLFDGFWHVEHDLYKELISQYNHHNLLLSKGTPVTTKFSWMIGW